MTIILLAFGLLTAITLIGVLSFSAKDRQVLLGDVQKTSHSGLERTYRVATPATQKPTSILIALHGLGGSGSQMAYLTGLHNIAPGNMLVVYPDASPAQPRQRPGWNADFCCGSGWLNKVDDAGFIMKLIEELKTNYGAPDAKVFVAGFSNGAMFTHKLVAAYPNVFAGFAAINGTIGTNDIQQQPLGPVSALLMHGGKDTIIPIEGGAGKGEPDFVWRSFGDTTSAWEQSNACEDAYTEETANAKITNYETCTQPLRTVVFPNEGHVWHDWRLFRFWHKKPAGSHMVIDFFNSLQPN